jgi:hypothetical protein
VVSGRRVLLFQLRTLHADGERAERAGLRRTVAARLLAGTAVVLAGPVARLAKDDPGRSSH